MHPVWQRTGRDNIGMFCTVLDRALALLDTGDLRSLEGPRLYWTVTVTVCVERPYWLVEERM